MCRHVAVLARDPIALEPPLFGPGPSLERQSYAPANQEVGRVNADGWGVGWWDPAIRPEPARYRTSTPMWADRRFREVVPLVRSRSFLAAVRNVTVGAPSEESGNAPFRSGRWLFSFNGAVDGFRGPLGAELRRSLDPAREREILGASDSEVVFSLVLQRLDDGADAAEATATVVAELRDRTTGRFNLLLSDGATVVATRCGNELATLADDAGGGARWIASERLTDDPRWQDLPPDTISVATLDALDTRPLR